MRPFVWTATRVVTLVASLAVTGCNKGNDAAEAAPAAELPITKVVLYQNGVGYFERRGQIKEGKIELRVRPDQINDVLKSLSILDLSGGQASSVSLPVERSGDRLAAELPHQVRNATGMLGLLGVLRGAQVEVDGVDGTLSGRVVGVEIMPRPADAKEGDKGKGGGAVLTLIAGENKLLTTPVEGIKKLTIGDRTLAVGLQQSLDISKSDGAWKPVSLTVRLAGDKTHDLIVSYIHEVPIWRPAYRAWVEPASAGPTADGKSRGVRLQGWAIVDNTSGEAWRDVKLSLVVGTPLSFRYNLHTPHHVTRPDLSPRLPTVADAPPEPDVGMDSNPMESPAASAATGMAPSAPQAEAASSDKSKDANGERQEKEEYAEPMRKRAAAARPKSRSGGSGSGGGGGYGAADSPKDEAREEGQRREAAIRSAQALVTGKEVGALYTYESTVPVTVPDRSAALINIVNKTIEGEDVFLFREPSSGQAPFRAVMLKNAKDAALESGPITLYVDGHFAGEGFIGRVGKGETAFVPYARESGFALNLKDDTQAEELQLARVVDGRIRLEGKRTYIRIVTLESTRDQATLAYVKLSLRGGKTTLVTPPKELVKAGNEVYVGVRVPAKGKGEARLVEEEPVEYEEVGVSERALAAFHYYLKGKNLEEKVAGPIRELLNIHAELTRIEAERSSLHTQRNELDHEQTRIQGNLDALPAGAVAADLRRQLVGQLEGASRKAAEVAKKLVEAEVKMAALKEKEVVALRLISLK